MNDNQRKKLYFSLPDNDPVGTIPSLITETGNYYADEVSEEMITGGYYDTPERVFEENHLTVRTQKKEHGVVLSIITKDVMEPDETEIWSHELSSDSPSTSELTSLISASPFGAILAENQLHLLVEEEYQTLVLMLEDECSEQIKLTLRFGTATKNEKSESFCELELDLLQGELCSLVALAHELSLRHSLRYECCGMTERALMSDDESDTIQAKQENSADLRDPGSRDAAMILLAPKIPQILQAQHHFLLHPDNPESIHQLRVRIRQTRALLSFFRPILQDEQYEFLNTTLRDFANRFSPLREYDVLSEQWIQFRTEHPQLALQKSCLHSFLRRKRQSELKNAFAYLSSAQSTSLIFGIWQEILDLSVNEKGTVGFSDFSKKRLKKWTDSFESGLKKLTRQDATFTHSLRILGKKIRYVHEAMDDTNKEKKPASLRFKAMQTTLGEISDANRNREILTEASRRSKDCELIYEIGLILGYQASRSQELMSELIYGKSKT
ncbi:MAG: CHAD domain-containing protein [Anaerofustis sp.]